jgi:hypothetical protein
MTHRLAAVLLAVAVVLGLSAAPAAQAECGVAPPVVLDFGKTPRLLPTMHAVARLDCGNDGREYDYVVQGYFKVAGKTVARLPSFSGHSGATDARLSVPVTHATRHTIRASARRHGARRTTLTLVYRLTQTNVIGGDQAPRTTSYAEDSFLTIFASNDR